jgi:processing peptidase subunit beta
MASRRLALNLAQSLRSKTAIRAVKARNASRGLATPIAGIYKTESTTLPNGLTVCVDLVELLRTMSVKLTSFDLNLDRYGVLPICADFDRWCLD